MAYREGAHAMVFVAFGTHVIAMDRATGRRVWMAAVNGLQTPRVFADGSRVYVLSSDLYCFDALSGQAMWRVEAKGTTLLVDNDMIFVAGEGEAAAYRTSDGAVIWRDGFKGMGLGWVSLAVPGHAQQADVS